MDLIDLNATVRKETGKGPARRLRAAGRIPAVVYGPSVDNIPLTIDVREFDAAVKDTNIAHVLLNLKIRNGRTKPRPVMIKDLQVEPVSRNYVHADFLEIAMDREINVSVPVETVGHCPGVEEGGILQIIRRELDVTCLPSSIPDIIEVDVSTLNIGDSIHVEEVVLPEGVEVIADVNFTVITVASPTREELPEEMEEEEEGLEGEEAEGEGEAEAEEAGE